MADATDRMTQGPRDELKAFYERINPLDMAPLWESLHVLVGRQPVCPAAPHIWRYQQAVRPMLMEAGRLISAQEAERRVLILENPAFRGMGSITQSLYAGLQLVLPGEVAPSHRHTQNALRFILEGEGAHTTVDGEPTVMRRGDLVITPAWRWHEHVNETDRPMVWLDALDIPLVNFLSASFAEPGSPDAVAPTRPPGDSHMRYGANLAPVDWVGSSKSSPIFNYPYARSRETLDWMRHHEPPDAAHGHKLRYVNPASGGHVTPTMAAFVQLLPAGFKTSLYRSTDSTIFAVVEGEGETSIGDRTFTWSAGDVFVAPSWLACTHAAVTEAVLFSVSDRPVQEVLGLWREARAKPME